MKQRNWIKILTAVCLICLVFGGLALAQSGGTFHVVQSTVDGGGGSSSGGQFLVRGTVGQADAGMVSGGDFQVNGGFWHSREPDLVYLPIIVR